MKKEKKKNNLKVFGFISFIILLLLYSFFLLQSKFFLEADASAPTHNVVVDKQKEQNDKASRMDDFLDPDELRNKNSKEETKVEEKSQTEEPSKPEQVPDPVVEVDKPTTSTPKPEDNEDPKETPSIPSRAVYLTFDDGPHKVSVEILALLEKYNAKATFFMLDNNIKQYPDAVKEMVNKGHSVGLHGVTHDKKKFYQSSQSVVGEMNQTKQTIFEITGVETDLIRTPFGSSPHMTDGYKQAVAAQGYKLWDWNIDSRDWQFRDGRYVDSVIEQLNKLNRVNEPIVILLHERPETLQHLPRLLDYLTQQGYEFKALDSSMHPIQLF
ncbi:polysaccharide deacetylase family protein [Fredinandcohnia humi]